MSKYIVIERAVPTNKKLYSSVKSRIKKKFKVWPSAYASAALVKAYKAAGGGYRNESTTVNNPVYRLESYKTNECGKITELNFGIQEGGTEILGEAEYRGRKVSLGKPFRTPGGPKKFAVYVRKPGGGIKKISFGDTTGLSAKINNPQARKAFSARHDCPNKKDRTKASYWSCRLPRYAKLLGLKSNFSGFW